jgi:hypothetical protein
MLDTFLTFMTPNTDEHGSGYRRWESEAARVEARYPAAVPVVFAEDCELPAGVYSLTLVRERDGAVFLYENVEVRETFKVKVETEVTGRSVTVDGDRF